jgi:hypothetical protein
LTLCNTVKPDASAVTLVGFITDQKEPSNEPGTYHPITDLADLPEHGRRADKVAKGPGMRMYNTRTALLGAPTSTDRDNLYAMPISIGDILDMRRPSDATMMGRLDRIVSHAERLRRANRDGLGSMVARVQESYRDTRAVLFTQPPAAALRQFLRRIIRLERVPKGVTDQFLIAQDRSLTLRCIGTRR